MKWVEGVRFLYHSTCKLHFGEFEHQSENA